MKPFKHPLILPPRRSYRLGDGRILIVGGIHYDESRCECKKEGADDIQQAAGIARDENEIPSILSRMEALERAHR